MKLSNFCINVKILIKIFVFLFLFSFLLLFFANMYVSMEVTYSLLVSFMMTIVVFYILSPLFLLIPIGILIETIIYKRKLNIKNTWFVFKSVLNFCRYYFKGDVIELNRLIESNLIDKKYNYKIVKNKFIIREFTAYVGDNFFIIIIKITDTSSIIKIHSSDMKRLKELKDMIEKVKKGENI